MISVDPVAGFRSIGQPIARRAALQAASRSSLGRTWLVHGPPGADTASFVDDLLALAFCEAEPDAERPCNRCRGCRDARARVHPDLVIGSPDRWREARSTGESIVAVARRWLLDAAGAPVVADRRVVVIENVDRANEQTQNVLLKVLEEPTSRHAFVLVADEPMRVLPTIRSRSQPLRIGPVPKAELVAHLVDVERLPQDLADALARISGGLSGRAVEYAGNGELLAWRRRTQGQLLDLLERGRSVRFAAVRDLLDGATPFVADAPATDDDAARTPAAVQRGAASMVVDAWLALTRDLVVAAAGRPALAPGLELGDGIPEAAGRVGVAPFVRMATNLERIHGGLRENAAPRLSLEAAMLAWPMSRP